MPTFAYTCTCTAMSTCGCQPLREQRTSCSATQNTDIPSVRLSVPLFRTFVAKFCSTCVLLVCTYLFVRMNGNERIDRARARDGGKETDRKLDSVGQLAEIIRFPTSFNPEEFCITYKIVQTNAKCEKRQ